MDEDPETQQLKSERDYRFMYEIRAMFNIICF